MSKFSIFIFISFAGWAADGHYDLGGPCKDVAGSGVLAKILEAKNSGSWELAIELGKTNVREGCSIEYRWHELVNALLEGHRQTEAVQVLQEMESRGFNLNPSMIGRDHPDVEKFMEGSEFKASPAGIKIEQLKKIANERRARFREVLRKLPPDQKPPDHYIAKGVCPFECCRYGNWTVLKDTDLVVAPGSQRVVGKAKKGGRVAGLTGDVYLKPEPVVVLMNGDLPKDSIAFVLDYEGEGVGHVFTRGKIIDVFLGVADYCFGVSESCWGETLLPSSERKEPVWWVKVRLANGIVGWTDKADRFGDKDGCG